MSLRPTLTLSHRERKKVASYCAFQLKRGPLRWEEVLAVVFWRVAGAPGLAVMAWTASGESYSSSDMAAMVVDASEADRRWEGQRERERGCRGEECDHGLAVVALKSVLSLVRRRGEEEEGEKGRRVWLWLSLTLTSLLFRSVEPAWEDSVGSRSEPTGVSSSDGKGEGNGEDAEDEDAEGEKEALALIATQEPGSACEDCRRDAILKG